MWKKVTGSVLVQSMGFVLYDKLELFQVCFAGRIRRDNDSSESEDSESSEESNEADAVEVKKAKELGLTSNQFKKFVDFRKSNTDQSLAGRLTVTVSEKNGLLYTKYYVFVCPEGVI